MFRLIKRERPAAYQGYRVYPAAFWVSLAANAFFFFSFQATFPVLPRFIADVVVGQPPENVGGQVGLATTVLALVAMVARIPVGRLTDRFGRVPFLLLGAICFMFAPLIYATSRGMPVLLLGRGVQGVGLATFSTAHQAFVTDVAPQGRRGEALGLAGASVSVAFVSAPLIGDWLANSRGYASLFHVCAASAALSMLLVVVISVKTRRRLDLGSVSPRDARAQGSSSLSGVQAALRQKGVRAGVLTMAALGIPFAAFITFLPLFADEAQIVGVGVVFSVYAGTTMLVQPLAGRLSDRMGRVKVILPGLVVTSLATLVLAINGSLGIFALGGLLFGLGGGLARGGVDALVQDSVLPTLRGTAAAVQYTSFDFWIGMGSYPIGLLAAAIGYAATFIAAGATCLFGGGSLALIMRNKKPDGTSQQQLSDVGQ